MAGLFWYIADVIQNLFAINEAGDGLEINDEGDLLLY